MWMLIQVCRAQCRREGRGRLRRSFQRSWKVSRSSSYDFTDVQCNAGSSSKLAASWQSLVNHLVKLPTFETKIGDDISLPIPALSHLSDSTMSLPDLISTSQTTKARLLHYFPPTPGTAIPAEDEPVDSWCGFHLDHSLLTGLCSVSGLSFVDITCSPLHTRLCSFAKMMGQSQLPFHLLRLPQDYTFGPEGAT